MRMKNKTSGLRLSSVGEREAIRMVAGIIGTKYIGDDCAVLRVPPGHELLVTTDLTIEQVHFRREKRKTTSNAASPPPRMAVVQSRFLIDFQDP